MRRTATLPSGSVGKRLGRGRIDILVEIDPAQARANGQVEPAYRAILEAKSMHEAIELTKRFLRVHGEEWDLECEVRQLDGPEFGSDAS